AIGEADRVVVPAVRPTLIVVAIRLGRGDQEIDIFFTDQQHIRGAVGDVLEPDGQVHLRGNQRAVVTAGIAPAVADVVPHGALAARRRPAGLTVGKDRWSPQGGADVGLDRGRGPLDISVGPRGSVRRQAPRRDVVQVRLFDVRQDLVAPAPRLRSVVRRYVPV